MALIKFECRYDNIKDEFLKTRMPVKKKFLSMHERAMVDLFQPQRIETDDLSRL